MGLHPRVREAGVWSSAINPYVINWIVSFLSNRKQRVVVDGFVTEFANNFARYCPRAHIVLHYVSDIRPVYQEPNLLLKYADDLTQSVPVSAHKDHSFIEVDSIQHWVVRNYMKLLEWYFPCYCYGF